jgi:hypothetical protein
VVTLTKTVLRSPGFVRLWAAASLLAAVVLGVVAGVAGAKWLNHEEDLDAQALELALHVRNIAVSIPQPPTPRPTRNKDTDLVPPTSPGYQWVAFEDDLLSKSPMRLLRYHTWSGAILGRSGVAGAFHVHEDLNGDAIVTISRSLDSEADQPDHCRPVAFDNQGRRFGLTFERTARCKSELGDMAAVVCFRLSHELLPFDRIHAIGVERAKPEVLRQTAPAAAKLASANLERPRQSQLAVALSASPGSSWVIGPLSVARGDWTAAASSDQCGVVCALSRTAQGVLNIDIVYPSRTRVHNVGGCDEEYRPVVFDTSGHRRVMVGTQPYALESGAAASAAATSYAYVRPSPLFGDIMQMAPSDSQTYGSADIGVF